MNIWIVLIYRFRRQHEQLRQVILRVLRPAKSPMPAVPSESQSAAEPIAIDLADNSSIDVRIPRTFLYCFDIYMNCSWSVLCEMCLSVIKSLLHMLHL